MRRLPLFVVFALLTAGSFVSSAQQNATIARGENLVVDGIPPIPASLAEEVQRYTESRPAQLADWHPTRREMLISTRFGNTAQIHRVRMPGGARTQVTFFTEPVTSARFEPTEARYFVFARDIGGNEFAQLYRYDIGSGRSTLLTGGGRSQNGSVVWSTKGDRIAYASTRRNGTDRDLYVMDPADPKTESSIRTCAAPRDTGRSSSISTTG